MCVLNLFYLLINLVYGLSRPGLIHPSLLRTGRPQTLYSIDMQVICQFDEGHDPVTGTRAEHARLTFCSVLFLRLCKYGVSKDGNGPLMLHFFYSQVVLKIT